MGRKIYEIPIELYPHLNFDIVFEKETVNIAIDWNARSEQWYMDIKGITFDLDVMGITLTTNVNLLGPYAIAELGTLIVVDTEGKAGEPAYDNFGTRFRLCYLSKP